MKKFRIIILLLILVLVAFYSKLQKLESMSWIDPLQVSIYPINADGSLLVNSYINRLSENDFLEIEQFFSRQYTEYSDIGFMPVNISLEAEVIDLPPVPPENGYLLSIVWWSLHMRYWAYLHSTEDNQLRINIFVLYHRPEASKSLAHSLGLQKGLLGVVNAFAADNQRGQNNVVVAHELLHTVGASDKYDKTSGQPVFPDGFAKNSEMRYPQIRAELMAGRIPITAVKSVMPDSLRQCVLGKKTVQEIGWIE